MKKIAITIAGAALALTTLGAQAGAPQAPAAQTGRQACGSQQAVERAAHAGRQAGLPGQLDQRDADPARTAGQHAQPGHVGGRGGAAREGDLADRRDRLAQPSDPDRPAPPKGGDGSTGAAGNVGGYNNFWLAPGEHVAVIDGKPRSSIIVDPPDGKVPATTPEGQQRARARLAAFTGRGQYRSSRAPAAGRALHRLVRLERRAADVAELLLQQQLHDRADQGSRDDPRRRWSTTCARSGSAANACPRTCGRGSATRSDAGKATRSSSRRPTFTRSQLFRGASDNLKVTERFTRTGPDTILYRFTVDDPTTFTRPWTGEVPFNRMDELIYEYACHEGNYALSNVLSGERNKRAA